MKHFNSILKTLVFSTALLALAGTAQAAASLSNGKHLPRLITKVNRPDLKGNNHLTVNDAPAVVLGDQEQALKPLRAAEEPAFSFDGLPMFEYLTSPDGSTWYYTLEYKIEKIVHNEYWTEEMIMGFTLNIYDETMAFIGSVKDKITLAPGETRARTILPEPTLSRHFFNTDDKIEVMVQHTMNTEIYVNHDYYKVYSIGGEKDADGNDVAVAVMEGLCADTANAGTADDEDFYFTFYTQPDRSTFSGTIPSQEYIDFLNTLENTLYTYSKAQNDTDGPVLAVEKGVSVTRVPGDTTDGIYFITKPYGGKLYLFYSHYELPLFVEPVVLNGDESQTPGNSFIIEAYVIGDDGKAQPVSTTKIPFEYPDVTDQVVYAYYSIGSVAWTDDIDMSVNGTPQAPAYIVARDIENMVTEELTSNYEIYNNAGKLVRTISADTESLQLLTLEGVQPQIMTVYVNNDADYVFGFYNLYDGDLLFEMPQQNYGDPLIAYAALVRNTDGDINYVFQMRDPGMDDDSNIYARVGWFDAKGKQLRVDNVNMGKNVQAYTINLDPAGLDPYIYDEDEGMEYVVLVKRYKEALGTTRNEFLVVDESGSHYANFSADDGRGDPFMFTLLPGDPNRILMVYQNEDSKLNADIYDLPFLEGIEDVESGIDGIVADGDAAQGPARYYNLNGVEVRNPQPGTIVIKVAGGKAQKIIVK